MPHFIIITNPRNGSTWFSDALNNVPNITCHDELLVKTKYRLPPEYFQSEEYLKRVKSYPHWEYFKKRNKISLFKFSKFFDYFDQNLSKSTFGGFKLMFKQMFRHPLIIPYMIIKRVSIIRLKRQNLLNIILSWETMKLRDRGHNTKSVKQVTVHLDPNKTFKEIKKLDFWDKATDFFCKFMPVPVYEIVYEEIIADPSKWSELIYFITQRSSEQSKIVSKYKKSNTSHHQEMIENYEQIKEILTNTKYQRYINET